MATARWRTCAKGISVYKLLDEEAAAMPPGAHGLIVLDYFQGNRTPHTDSFARGESGAVAADRPPRSSAR
ncbi:MAG: hypothetical protein R2851_06540 [Caldilineaceae bacterium]